MTTPTPTAIAQAFEAVGPNVETYVIQKRWSWLTAVSVEIECAPDTNPRVKLGLAVRAAFEKGADLTGADLTHAVLTHADLTGADLTGADLTGAVLTGADLTRADLTGADLTGADLRGAVLTGADLTGADLTGAVLRGADLTGAVLRGAVLRGEKIVHIFARANRQDGHAFYGVELAAGGWKIAAGCQWRTLDDYRRHVAEDYPGRPNAQEQIAETTAILDFLEARARQTGVATVAEAVA